MRARDNPFRVERVDHVGYRLPGRTCEELLARLAALGYRAAILGEEGRGKTRLLEELAERLPERGFTPRWLRLARPNRWLSLEQRAVLRRLDDRSVLLVDGADELGRLGWRELKWRSRRSAGLVVTSHRNGLLPTLVECTTTADLLEDIVTEIRGDGPAPGLPPLPQLFERHRGNLRGALRELYDVASSSSD